jgi:hypothetical protein
MKKLTPLLVFLFLISQTVLAERNIDLPENSSKEVYIPGFGNVPGRCIRLTNNEKRTYMIPLRFNDAWDFLDSPPKGILISDCQQPQKAIVVKTPDESSLPNPASTPKPTKDPAPITEPKMSCGDSNGKTFANTQPTSGLCSDSSKPVVTNNGCTWSWSCGTNSCSANRTYDWDGDIPNRTAEVPDIEILPEHASYDYEGNTVKQLCVSAMRSPKGSFVSGSYSKWTSPSNNHLVQWVNGKWKIGTNNGASHNKWLNKLACNCAATPTSFCYWDVEGFEKCNDCQTYRQGKADAPYYDKNKKVGWIKDSIPGLRGTACEGKTVGETTTCAKACGLN